MISAMFVSYKVAEHPRNRIFYFLYFYYISNDILLMSQIQDENIFFLLIKMSKHLEINVGSLKIGKASIQ